MAAGDEIEGTVTAREKRAAGHEIVFDCRVHKTGEDLITGTVTVEAPTARISYTDLATPEIILRRNDAFARLLQAL